MISYSQFCPVAKAAEVFGDRWTPIIMRELCFGPRAFGELLAAAPLISRTVLAQRLKGLAQAGVIYIEAKAKGKGHLYRLTPAGEDFRPIVELLSIWGQRWGQGLIGPDDLDPGMLVWGMRRQIDLAEIPQQGFVIRLDFRGIPKSCHSPRYWWLVLRPEDIEVCLKRWKILRRHSACVLEAGKSEAFELWLVGKRKQPTCCPDRSHGAMQGDLSALKRGYKSDIAEPRLCEGIKIRRDDHVDIPCGS